MKPHRMASVVAGAFLLSATVTATPSSAQTTTARRVWADPVEDARDGSDLSPDGRLYAFTARPGDLAVRTLATGEMRYLTGPLARVPTSDASAYTPAFSRDGKQLAYAWDVDSLPGYEVRVIDIDGSSARTIYRPVGDVGPIPTDWTPDGRFVVALESTPERTMRIVLLPVSGGTPRVLKSFLDWQRPTQAQLSPDGSYLAYDYRPRKEDVGRDVYLLALDGTRESSVITGSSDDHLVGWTPDGRVVFTSDRGGSAAVWTVRIENGRARGEPVLVKKDLWRSTGLLMADNGTFFYSVQTGDRDVFSAAFDPLAGKLLSKPVGITQHAGEAHSAPNISPSGRFIAYFTGPLEGRPARYARFGTTSITVQSLQGGQSRMITPRLGGISGFMWGQDEESLILQALDDKGRPATHRLDLKTGDVSAANYPLPLANFSRDHEWLFGFADAGGKLRERLSHVFARRVSGGEERVIYSSPEPGWLAGTRGGRTALLISPDGRSLVFGLSRITDSAYLHRVFAVETQGGTPRELLSPTAFPGHALRLASFTPDGKYVLLQTQELTGIPDARPSRLWRVPVGGGAPLPVEMPRADFDVPILSPDGRRLLFTAGKVAPEYWVLEDPRLGFGRAQAASPTRK